jgi:ribonuclease PH
VPAAVSVGIVDGKAYLDLDYILDSRAEVDMNVAYTVGGKFVEIQGSAENGQGFERRTMDTLLDLAVGGCKQIMVLRREALAS